MSTTTTQTSDASGDRRRARDQRGIRSSAAVKGGDRLPSPPRQRRPALAALAVLLIVGGAAVAALLAMRVDSRVPVLQANQTIAAGQELTAEMFTTTQVAAEDTALVRESQLDQVVGLYAKSTIQATQLLDATMVESTSFLEDGMVSVGAALAVGRYPAEGLQSGDVVDLVQVGDSGSEILVRNAKIGSTGGSSTEEDAAGRGANTVTEVSLIVRREDSAEVAAANVNGQLAVVLVERSGTIGEAAETDDPEDDPTADPTADPTGDPGESGEGGED